MTSSFTLRLPTRETLALAAVVLLVVTVATVAHLASVAQITVRAAADEGGLLARQLFHQTAHALSVSGPDRPSGWRHDPGIRVLLAGMVGYSRLVVYGAVVDPEGRVLVHSDPALEDTTLPPRRTIDEVRAWGTLATVFALLGPPQVFEARLPIRRGDRPFGVVRVGLSTSLVRHELTSALLTSLALGAAAMVVAVAVGLGAGRVLLRVGRTIVRGVERLARGEFGSGVELTKSDAMGALAEQVNRLGEEIEAGRASGAPAHARAVESLVTYAQKLAALGRLTSGVAHEVKNPLNAMRIHLELLRVRLGEPSPQVSLSLDVIAHEIQRLDRVVQGFLRFMRPQDLRLAPVDVNAVLADIARLAGPEATRQGVDIALRLAAGLPAVSGDAELLQQAVTNLVTNAIQAMPKGGLLTLASRHESHGAVAVLVRDQGVGIALEDLQQIFRLYYTTKEQGSGLGLPLVYRIVQLHDGRIDVESVVGEGTTMTIVLPLGPTPAAR